VLSNAFDVEILACIRIRNFRLDETLPIDDEFKEKVEENKFREKTNWYGRNRGR
jgi:hypothetical protein